jgi:hypothetical protein
MWLKQEETRKAGRLMIILWCVAGIIWRARQTATVARSVDLVFAAQALCWTLLLSGLLCAFYGVKCLLSPSAGDDEGAENAGARAERYMLLWMYALTSAGLLVCVTEALFRAESSPTHFMSVTARQATVVIFAALILAAQVFFPVSRARRGGRRKSEIFVARAAAAGFLFVTAGACLSHVRDGAASVAPALLGGLRLVYFVTGALSMAFLAASVWHRREERLAHKTASREDA